jgi:hypothetical protein
MHYVTRLALSAGALTLSLGSASAHVRWHAPPATRTALPRDGNGAGYRDDHSGGFSFRTSARDSLRTLWVGSVAAREERVACIGGVRLMGTAYVTRVLPLAPAAADSMHVSAAASIKQCGAPEWFGTVHTHIAKFGGRPFVTFSPDDRRVMSLWRKRWHAEGVFCVLYSETAAHCEAGDVQSGDPVYAHAPGERPGADVTQR